MWSSDEPDCFLEISEEAFKAKRAALYSHVSQFGGRNEQRESRARSGPEGIGRKIGVPLAEQFKLVAVGG